MSALIELTESLLEHLEMGKAEGIPVIDFAVEAVRLALRKGYVSFISKIEREFMGGIPKKSDRKRLLKRFMEVNRLRLAELVLTEREV